MQRELSIDILGGPTVVMLYGRTEVDTKAIPTLLTPNAPNFKNKNLHNFLALMPLHHINCFCELTLLFFY